MKQLIPALFAVGAVMLLAGAAVYITGWPLSPYIYTVGATMVALAQINSPSKCKSPTVKRLRRQQIFGALLLASFNHYAMQELKRISPQSKTGLLYSTMLIDPWNAAMAANADALHPFFPCIANTPCMIPKCRKNGIAVNTWTVDEPEYIRAMFMLGVDSVITNKPDVAKSVRNELSNDAENTVN